MLLLLLLQHAFCRSRSLAAIAFREVCRPWEAKLRRIFSRRDTGASTVFVTTISAYRAGNPHYWKWLMYGILAAWALLKLIAMWPGRESCHKWGPFYKSDSGCCPAGPLRGSLGRNEKLLRFIRPLIRKPSFLKGFSFWKKLGSGRQSLPLLQGKALLLY